MAMNADLTPTGGIVRGMGENEDRKMDRDRDERVSIPLDPEVALRALLKVDPAQSDPAGGNREDDDEAPRGDADE